MEGMEGRVLNSYQLFCDICREKGLEVPTLETFRMSYMRVSRDFYRKLAKRWVEGGFYFED